MESRSGTLRVVYPHDADEAVCDAPRLDTDTIFKALIASELRAGRLTRAGRQRIVRYAAQLGLSAGETGRLIQECRAAALESENPGERRLALRIPANEDNDEAGESAIQPAMLVSAALILQLLILAWAF